MALQGSGQRHVPCRAQRPPQRVAKPTPALQRQQGGHVPSQPGLCMTGPDRTSPGMLWEANDPLLCCQDAMSCLPRGLVRAGGIPEGLCQLTTSGLAGRRPPQVPTPLPGRKPGAHLHTAAASTRCQPSPTAGVSTQPPLGLARAPNKMAAGAGHVAQPTVLLTEPWCEEWVRTGRCRRQGLGSSGDTNQEDGAPQSLRRWLVVCSHQSKQRAMGQKHRPAAFGGPRGVTA